jgi:hypothetical protein
MDPLGPFADMLFRWYLSARAVRSFARLRRLPLDDGGPLWAKAERLLEEVCARSHLVTREDGSPRLTRQGLQEWRTGLADGRIRLLVSTAKRPEGELDQLVEVLPAFGR